MGSLMNSEAGYVAKLVSSFVSSGSPAVFAYLSAHASTVIENLTKNLMHCGTLDIARFLLDVPLQSRMNDGWLIRRWQGLVGRERCLD